MSSHRYPYEIGVRVLVDSFDGAPSYCATIVSYAVNGVWVRSDDGLRFRVAWWRLSRASA